MYKTTLYKNVLPFLERQDTITLKKNCAILREHSIIAAVAGRQVKTSAPFVRDIIPALLSKFVNSKYNNIVEDKNESVL